MSAQAGFFDDELEDSVQTSINLATKKLQQFEIILDDINLELSEFDEAMTMDV